MLLELPDNFQFTADQAAMLCSCSKDTIINNTHPSKAGTRYYIKARRSTPKAPLKIMVKDLVDFMKRTERGYLPNSENE